MLRRPDENKTPQSRERLIEATTKRDPNSTRFRSQNNPSKPAKNRQANPSAERILKIAYDITYVQVLRRFFLTMKAWKSRCGPPFIGTIATTGVEVVVSRTVLRSAWLWIFLSIFFATAGFDLFAHRYLVRIFYRVLSQQR